MPFSIVELKTKLPKEIPLGFVCLEYLRRQPDTVSPGEYVSLAHSFLTLLDMDLENQKRSNSTILLEIKNVPKGLGDSVLQQRSQPLEKELMKRTAHP